MRKICCSAKLAPIAALIAWAEARSLPSGFSSTRRVTGVTEPGSRQVRGDRPEQLRRGREVEAPHRRIAPGQGAGQGAVGGGLGRIEFDVVEARRKALPRLLVELRRRQLSCAGLPDQLPVGIAAHGSAGDGDDAPVLRQAVLLIEVIERGQQLSLGEVAPAAEHDHVERLRDQCGLGLLHRWVLVDLLDIRRRPARRAPIARLMRSGGGAAVPDRATA